MEQKTINISMELIGISGEAKGLALKSLKLAKLGDIEKAMDFFQQAKNKLNSAHKLHMEIISQEAQGYEWQINTLFIHAQDHFSNTLIILDLLEYIIDLYRNKDKIDNGSKYF